MNAIQNQDRKAFKSWTRRAAVIHRGMGGSAFSLTGENLFEEGAYLVNRSPDERTFKKVGSTLLADDLRRFLWDERKNRLLSREDTILWTAYDEESDVSVVGLASPVNDRVTSTAERIGVNLEVVEI